VLGQQALGTPEAHDTHAWVDAIEGNRCDPRLVVLVQVIQHASYDDMTDALLAATNVIVLNQHPHDGTIDRALFRRVEQHTWLIAAWHDERSPGRASGTATACYRALTACVASCLMPHALFCAPAASLLHWAGRV
jgi:hypothetical protein